MPLTKPKFLNTISHLPRYTNDRCVKPALLTTGLAVALDGFSWKYSYLQKGDNRNTTIFEDKNL